MNDLRKLKARKAAHGYEVFIDGSNILDVCLKLHDVLGCDQSVNGRWWIEMQTSGIRDCAILKIYINDDTLAAALEAKEI